jgi:hypothetical protein
MLKSTRINVFLPKTIFWKVARGIRRYRARFCKRWILVTPLGSVRLERALVPRCDDSKSAVTLGGTSALSKRVTTGTGSSEHAETHKLPQRKSNVPDVVPSQWQRLF